MPGAVPARLIADDLTLIHPDEQVFDAMLEAWRTQLLARGLSTEYIKSSLSLVRRFRDHHNEYPWSWSPGHFEEYMADRRNGPKAVSRTTLRSDAGKIRAFCAFLTQPTYGWAPVCERLFGAVPTQVVFDWNSPRHTTDDDVPAHRRSLTKAELQRFFDAADDLVDEEYRSGSKAWISSLRDSTALKVTYAYGLRRREVAKLEYVDFGPNPHVPQFRDYGALQVRWAKGTAGSGPRRRTVLTVPEFSWVVELLDDWLSPQRRGRFATAERSTLMWPSEREAGISLPVLGRAFKRFSQAADLDSSLTLHCLRHSYVTHLIEAGYDPLFVQQQVGHSYSSVTALYTSVSSDFKQKAVQRMIAKRLATRDGTGAHEDP